MFVARSLFFSFQERGVTKDGLHPRVETDFGQTDFGQNQLWPKPTLAGPDPVGARRVGARRVGPRKGGAPKGWGPEGWGARRVGAPKGGSQKGAQKGGGQKGGGPEGWGPKPRKSGGPKGGAGGEPKRAHLRVPEFKNTTKIQREDTPREGRKERILRREREKKREILGGPGEGRSRGRGNPGKDCPGKGGPNQTQHPWPKSVWPKPSLASRLFGNRFEALSDRAEDSEREVVPVARPRRRLVLLSQNADQTQRVSKEFLMSKMRNVQKHLCWKPLFWRRESKLGRGRLLLWIPSPVDAGCAVGVARSIPKRFWQDPIRMMMKATRGWKLLLLLPRMIFFRPGRGGSVPRSKLQARITSFQRGLWLELLAEGASCAERVHTQSVRRRRRQQHDDDGKPRADGRIVCCETGA